MMPIVLTKSFSISPNQTVELSADDFRNPFRKPMLIDEIRIRVTDTDGSPLVANPRPLSSIHMRLQVGRTPLTKEFVPIGNFGKVLPTRQPFADMAYVVWRLPKPLYVPGTEYLIPRFFYDDEISRVVGGTQPTLVPRLTYVGRTLDKGEVPPGVVQVPWVANWRTPMVQVVAGDTDITSSEADLVNPFGEPLHVQRFIGRAWSQLADNFATATGFPNLLGTTLRGADSDNQIMIRDEVPFGHIFNSVPNAWTINSRLSAHGFYIMQLRHNFSPPAVLDPVNYVWTDMSMVGYRNVDMR